jgi:hypothetical protein
MGSGIIRKGNRAGVMPDHFFKAFDLCVNNNLSKNMAMVMSRGFRGKGFIDASEGCSHYALAVMGLSINNCGRALKEGE